ncbi:MAG: hypothetical protein AAFO04_14770 [Cyanobacteria bacterium J06592_8]
MSNFSQKVNSKPNLLYQRLEEALQHGNEVQVVSSCGRFFGIPSALDEEFLELVNLYIPSDDENWEDEPYERTVWLIKISEIVAVAYPIQSLSKDQLESLINPNQTVFESED